MSSGFATADYRLLFLVGVVSFYAIEQYLRWRKGRALGDDLPPELAGQVTLEEYEKARAYNATKNHFGYAADAYALATQVVQVVWLWPALWRGVAVPPLDAHPLLPPLAFVLVTTIVETLAGAPVGILSTFWIEESYGFNNYTAWTYLKDQAVNFSLNIVMSVIMWVGLIVVVDYAGKEAWFYLWIFVSGLAFAVNLLYPVLIAPLTNTFGPVTNPAVRQGIEDLIAQTGLNCKKVFEVDGSKQSKHSNAYVAGMLGTKRIVVYDTLIKDLEGDVPMIKAVVGHEIGHSIEHHNWYLLGLMLINLFAMFWSYGFFQNTPAVVTSFGFDEVNVFLSLQCFMLVYCSFLVPLWTVAMNAVTRVLEFRADRYSVTLGYDIRPSLMRIYKNNKGDLNPDWLHSLWHHGHPPLLERLRAVTVAIEKTK